MCLCLTSVFWTLSHFTHFHILGSVFCWMSSLTINLYFELDDVEVLAPNAQNVGKIDLMKNSFAKNLFFYRRRNFHSTKFDG